MKSSKITIRTSLALAFDNCAFATYLKYILQVKLDVISANLPFGTSVHEACTGYILAEAQGDTSYDPVQVFLHHWEKALDTTPMEFSSLWGAEDLRQTGLLLVDQFPDKWRDTGLVPLVDEQGPMVERRLHMEIEDGLVLTGQPDVIAMDSEGDVIPLDVKTSASQYDEVFLLTSEQLTDYQMLTEANGKQLGLDEGGVAKVGFFEGIKRKVPKTSRGKGPEFLAPFLAPKRSPEQLAERRQKLIWMADDMRRGRYPKRPRMAYNTPCDMCEFRLYCTTGDKTNLIFPDEPQQVIALPDSVSAPII